MRQATFLAGACVLLVALTACNFHASPLTESESPSADPVSIVERIETAEQAGYIFTFASPLDALAAEYVKITLLYGNVDGDYVDAYHGPAHWREAVKDEVPNMADLAYLIGSFDAALAAYQPASDEEAFRKAQLMKLTRALAVRQRVVSGEAVSFDTESEQIYDVPAWTYDLTVYDQVLTEIDTLLPGPGSIAERVDAFRNTLAIPEDKLQPVFDRAIEECRARTAAHFNLPEGERFQMEFVNDKSWSGYNYYQGNYESLIQINTDFPIIIDRAVDLGCHEGYPGHHVWNLFIERELVRRRGWIEYAVNPLFSPFGPIAEGSGNYGISLAFPGDEKINFEREVLFPMAGLDPANALKLDALNALTDKLSFATNAIAKAYLDGVLSREEAVPLMQKYYLASAEKSEQRLRFVEKYRTYVINYNIGQDIVRAYVEGAGEDADVRWAAFEAVLTGPLTASDIERELKAPN